VSRPLIGVTGPRGRGWIMWICAAFSLVLHGARVRRIPPPLDPARLADLNGLVIGGGDDISATLYDGAPAPDVRLDPERDRLEIAALDHFWDTGAPILGICRGSQMMNVYRGGRLHQDVWAVFADSRKVRTPLPLKTVTVCEGARLGGYVGGRERFTVNSLHNQAVDALGEGMRVAARDEAGMIQAVEHVGPHFRIGVQWHPEFLFYKRPHRRLFRAFVRNARRNLRVTSRGDAHEAPADGADAAKPA
jgi:putative glutamine amidotransferase